MVQLKCHVLHISEILAIITPVLIINPSVIFALYTSIIVNLYMLYDALNNN